MTWRSTARLRCAPQLRVVLERRLRRIEAVVVAAEIRRDVELVGDLLLDPGELRGRDVVGVVEIVRAISLQLRGHVLGRIEIDLLQSRVRVVPVIRIADELDVRLHDPLVEPERAIADEVSGPRELATVLFHARPMHGISRRVREQSQEVGRRVRELDLERVVVDRAHADPFGRQPPRADLVRVLDRAQDERVDR